MQDVHDTYIIIKVVLQCLFLAMTVVYRVLYDKIVVPF